MKTNKWESENKFPDPYLELYLVTCFSKGAEQLCVWIPSEYSAAQHFWEHTCYSGSAVGNWMNPFPYFF